MKVEGELDSLKETRRNRLQRHLHRMAQYADVPDLARLQGFLRRLHNPAKHPFVLLEGVDAVKLPQVNVVGVQALQAHLQLFQGGHFRCISFISSKDLSGDDYLASTPATALPMRSLLVP